ncbi:MAG: TonB-dependent receptor, partial [Xanthomonadales bacterium]|nr:TonB-dependent receptor [Xanthomonadales bacterium]
VNLMYNAGYDLASGFEVYSFGSYSDRSAEGFNFFRYPVSANNVRSIHPEGFVPITEADVTDYSIAFGLRGEVFTGWRGDLSIVHGVNEFDQDLRNSVNSSLGEASPTAFDVANYKYEQTVINFDASRAAAWGAIPVHVAAGLELRAEEYRTQAGDPASFAAGDAIACAECVTFGNSDTARPGAQASFGLRPSDEVDESRFAVAAYLDLEFDLTERWLLSLAGRLEDYDDFGSTANYKVASRFELAPGLALRGSVSSGFRAPALAQAFFAGTTTSFGEGRSLVSTLSLPVTDPLAQANGARELEAEESINTSIGFTWFHDSGFSFTFDYYEVDIDDRIVLSENLDVEGVPGVGQVRFFTNAVDTETTGFDVVASYTLEEWRFLAAYNRTDTDITNVPDPAVFGIEERNTLETAPPEDKLVLTAEWAGETFTALVRGVRFGETERIFDFGGGFEPQQVYGAEWSLDAELGYRINDNWSVALGGNNLLDQYPDESIFDISFFGNLPYDTVSPLGFNGRFVYLETRFRY